MDQKFYVDFELLGVNALLNAAYVELEPTDSAPATPVEGTIYYDSTVSPQEKLPYFYDGTSWQNMYHFNGHEIDIGEEPADTDMFLIWDTDGDGAGGGSSSGSYAKVSYQYIKASTGYWTRAVPTGDNYLRPSTIADHVVLPLNAFVYFGVPTGDGDIPPDSSYIGMVDATPDYLRIHSDLDTLIDVQSDGVITFSFGSGSVWKMVETGTGTATSFYSQLPASSIGSDSYPLDQVYTDEIHFDNAGFNIVITIDTPVDGYTLTLPNADPSNGYHLQSTSAGILTWVDPQIHAPFTLNPTLTDVFTLTAQDLTTNASIQAGDLMVGAAANWGVLNLSVNDGFVLTETTTGVAWETAITLDSTLSSVFSFTDATRLLDASLSAGCLLYGDGSSNLQVRAKGNDGEILTLASGLPVWDAANDLEIPMGYSEDFDTTNGVIGTWSGVAAPYIYTITFANLNTATGIVISNEGGYKIQIYELTTYLSDPVYTEVECAATMDQTNDELKFFASTKFSGYIALTKLTMD